MEVLMDIDFSGEYMMPFDWERCPSCRWPHNPSKACPTEDEDESKGYHDFKYQQGPNR